jgi:K+:H+ antiporter subunit KhtU
LLFFLGLEFSASRLLRSGRHVGYGGAVDLVVNAGLGLVIGLVAFGAGLGAVVLAVAVYVSSSAITVKALIDFRRLADDETDLVLAILVFEDLVLALALGFVGGAGGGAGETLVVAAKALAFIGASLAASRWLARPIDVGLDRLPREFFLLAVVAFVVGMAAISDQLGLSDAIGALMAGIVLSETSVREKIEEVAILREPEPVTGAQPDDLIQRGDTPVTVGKTGSYAAFRRLLAGEA